MNRQKTVSRTFSFSRSYSRKTCVRVVCGVKHGQRLRCHRVSFVNDYADMRNTETYFILEKVKNQQKRNKIVILYFRKLGVSEVNYYADTVLA